ncbi:MAG: hypothetical protein H8E90_00400 [Anaerolineales bacterium]|nr:hypothetical protein [Anaerolineales bacterium]
MKTRLYGILNARTKRWWYHRQIREQGRKEEARRRERAQIRDDVVRLRAALECGGFLISSWGGWVLHYGQRQRLQSSRSGLDGPIPQACLLLGIPVIDLTTIPEDRIRAVLRLPSPDLLYDPEPPGGYRSFHHAPFDYVTRLYIDLGATLYQQGTAPWTLEKRHCKEDQR